jgi:hypothetical protein
MFCRFSMRQKRAVLGLKTAAKLPFGCRISCRKAECLPDIVFQSEDDVRYNSGELARGGEFNVANRRCRHSHQRVSISFF